MNILIKIGIIIGFFAIGIIWTRFMRFIFELTDADDTNFYEDFLEDVGAFIHVLLWPIFAGFEIVTMLILGVAWVTIFLVEM